MSWIKCSERLPAIGLNVLVKQKNSDILMIAEIDGRGIWVESCENLIVNGVGLWDTSICKVGSGSCDSVTHWQPLPEPPSDD